MFNSQKRKAPSLGLPSGRPGDAYSALDECNFVIEAVAEKADQNKVRARFSAWVLTAITVSVPVLILIASELGGQGAAPTIIGKVLPGALGALAAVLGRWIQVEQPHQRWTLYRRWQRLFEAERLRYRQKIGSYANDRDDRLAEFLAKGQVELDEEWATLIPKSRALVDDAEASP
jgi:hypothetical protein